MRRAAAVLVLLAWSLSLAAQVVSVSGVAIGSVVSVAGAANASIVSIGGVTVTHSSSYITSIQSFTVTIGAGSATGTATLSPSVDISKTVLFWGGMKTDEITNRDGTAYFTLTNTNTVTGTRDTTGAGTCTLYGVAVEFTAAAITSVQYGTVSMASVASNTATLSPTVDTTKSVVVYLGDNATNTAMSVLRRAAVTLTNTNTVTGNRGSSAGTAVLSYCVVEFTDTVLQSVQPLSATYTSSSTTDTATISAVTVANSLFIFGGVTTTGTSFPDAMVRGSLSSTTTLDWIRSGTGTTTRTPYGTVLEFKSGVLSGVQRGSIAVNTATSNTATISSATKSGALSTGYMTDAGVATYAAMSAGNTLTDATTVTAAKGSNGATATTSGYEVPTFQ